MGLQVPVHRVLDQAFADAGIPIDGVFVEDPRDRSTWRVKYRAHTSLEQRAAGAELLASIDLANAQAASAVADATATDACSDRRLQAAVLALWECIPSPTMTKAQLRARLVALYRSL